MKGPGFERDGARTTLVDGAEVEAHPDHVNIIWYMPVELLRLSYKTERPLRSAGLVLVGDLVQRRLSDLLELPRFTPAALDEVAVAFETHDLRPDTLVQGFAPENPHLVKRIRYATEVVRSIIWWQRRRIETEWSAAWQHFDQLEPLTKEDERLHTKVKDLQLPVRPEKTLIREGILRVGDLAQLTSDDVLAMHGMGRYGLRHIRDVLAMVGLTLGRWVEGWAASRASSR